ncbi:hypothetical protein K469DRAFT_103309 [Zopfia rhizophila CBS 207.26]|uniref:Secreted protein n=1 Tax=Zopfia rhizophila CBS 207.26 TaxID=1314779 RepID=A0A6A6EAT7_9PEZI|nr:hypothetical protein K469DRAFT_103309 [Zopfia rhizophila CBS 207.26]
MQHPVLVWVILPFLFLEGSIRVHHRQSQAHLRLERRLVDETTTGMLCIRYVPAPDASTPINCILRRMLLLFSTFLPHLRPVTIGVRESGMTPRWTDERDPHRNCDSPSSHADLKASAPKEMCGWSNRRECHDTHSQIHLRIRCEQIKIGS